MNASTVLIAQTHYVRMGVVQISLANLLIIALMVIALVLALVLPFPRGHEDSEGVSDVQH
ncbi:hypothetical protein [Nakamurella sp. PAMC28650]|uniref:hypothetical protein n=1 Tax=Nakamurella sp. PAMC28650 TaxID=2762325 RepID=UPI00164D121A|nr:hypothetical protein [Nakamurella sp. PAMC28650]QNK81990.1 hypothetical protein H7F38_04160 [Nakamurella sp. PAMC28650]